MQTYQAGNRTIPIEYIQPANPGSKLPILILHGADGLPGRGIPYRDLAAPYAAEVYWTHLPQYFEATDGHSRLNPLNPVNFAAWMNTIQEGISYILRQLEITAGKVV